MLFVADTCFGGGMTRDLDPRSEEMSFRQVPSYRLSTDLLKPVTTVADELLTEVDFDRTAFLAAVDRKTKAPEVRNSRHSRASRRLELRGSPRD